MVCGRYVDDMWAECGRSVVVQEPRQMTNKAGHVSNYTNICLYLLFGGGGLGEAALEWRRFLEPPKSNILFGNRSDLFATFLDF